MIAREFFLDARTNGWIFQSLKQFWTPPSATHGGSAEASAVAPAV